MVLDPGIVKLIRDEIGNGTDVNDNEPPGASQWGSLEDIFNDVNRGNSHVLRTALIVWRRRLNNLLDRSFDFSQEGTQMFRRQKVSFCQRRILDLELLVDGTSRQTMQTMTSSWEDLDVAAEF